MKNAVISSAILLTIIISLIVNSIILNKCADSLLERVEKLSDIPAHEIENANEILEYWHSIEPFVSISVVHSETEAVSRAAIQICEYAKSGNISEFVCAKAVFKEAVEHIKFSGQFSLETVL